MFGAQHLPPHLNDQYFADLLTSVRADDFPQAMSTCLQEWDTELALSWQARLAHLRPFLPYGKEYEKANKGLYEEEVRANRLMTRLMELWEEARTWEDYEEARQQLIHESCDWVTNLQDPSQTTLISGYRSLPAEVITQMEAYETAIRGKDLPDALWRDKYALWKPPADRLLFAQHWQAATSFLEYADFRGEIAAQLLDYRLTQGA